jgi:hypothetical protein
VWPAIFLRRQSNLSISTKCFRSLELVAEWKNYLRGAYLKSIGCSVSKSTAADELKAGDVRSYLINFTKNWSVFLLAMLVEQLANSAFMDIDAVSEPIRFFIVEGEHEYDLTNEVVKRRLIFRYAKDVHSSPRRGFRGFKR